MVEVAQGGAVGNLVFPADPFNHGCRHDPLFQESEAVTFHRRGEGVILHLSEAQVPKLLLHPCGEREEVGECGEPDGLRVGGTPHGAIRGDLVRSDPKFGFA